MPKKTSPSRETLIEWANEMSLRHWGVPYTGAFKLSNRRWIRRNGLFSPKGDPSGPCIEMCESRNSARTAEQVKGTLLHELVHWRLYCINQPHRDRNKEFVAECLRVGAPISKAKIAQQAYRSYMQSIGEVASNG